MRIARIWADGVGTSHFAEVDIELTPTAYAPPAPPFHVSAPMPSESARLFEFPADWYGDWHPSPHRQLYFNLGGHLEVTVGDGEVRYFGPGSVVLLEDTEGPGHVTKVMSPEPARGLFVQLSEDR